MSSLDEISIHSLKNVNVLRPIQFCTILLFTLTHFTELMSVNENYFHVTVWPYLQHSNNTSTFHSMIRALLAIFSQPHSLSWAKRTSTLRINSFTITGDNSAVSLLKSRKQRYIKVPNSNNTALEWSCFVRGVLTRKLVKFQHWRNTVRASRTCSTRSTPFLL